MAKTKNHTNHNQNKKAHKNGIRKPQHHRYKSKRGVYLPYARNLRVVRKNNERLRKIALKKNAEAKRTEKKTDA